jgi:hypothetical protein
MTEPGRDLTAPPSLEAVPAHKPTPAALRSGQIVHAHVLDKLPNEDLILFIRGNTYYARSRLPLDKGSNIIAKIQSLEPRLVLSLIPSPPDGAPGKNTAGIPEQLARLNVLSSPGAVEGARALLNEGVPIKEDTLPRFLRELSARGLSGHNDTAAAAKLFRLDLPMNRETVAAFRDAASSPRPGALPDFFRNLRETVSTLPDPVARKYAPLLDALDRGLERAAVPRDPSAPDIREALSRSVDFSGQGYEKFLLAESGRVLFSEEAFRANAPRLLEKLQSARTALAPDGGSPAPGAERLIARIDSLSEWIRRLGTLIERPGGTASRDFSRLLLKTVHFADALARPDDSRERIPPHFAPKGAVRETVATLARDLRDTLLEWFPDRPPPPPLRAPAAPDGNNIPAPPPADPSLNLKHILYSMERLCRDPRAAGQDTDPGIRDKTTVLEEEIRDRLADIFREQLLAAGREPAQKINPLNLFWQDEDGVRESRLFFKKRSVPNRDGTDQELFSIFFSLDLSRLGHFEINLLDVRRSLDLVFYSEDAGVRDFFEKNRFALEEKIVEAGIANFSIKTAPPPKHRSGTTPPADPGVETPSVSAPNRIDIMI